MLRGRRLGGRTTHAFMRPLGGLAVKGSRELCGR